MPRRPVLALFLLLMLGLTTGPALAASGLVVGQIGDPGRAEALWQDLQGRYAVLDMVDYTVVAGGDGGYLLVAGPLESPSLAGALQGELAAAGLSAPLVNIQRTAASPAAPAPAPTAPAATATPPNPPLPAALPAPDLAASPDPTPATAPGPAPAKASALPDTSADVPLDAPAGAQLDAPADVPLDAPSEPELPRQGRRRPAPATGGQVINEDNVLILDVVVNRLILYQDMIAYDDGNQVFLPLGALMNGVEFAVTVSPDLQRAEGWFLDPENTFALDRQAQTAEVRGEPAAYDDYKVRDDGFDIYVSTELLNGWFPLGIDVNFSTLQAQLSPTATLPVIARLEREQGRRITERGEYSIKNPLMDLDYSLFSPAGVDMLFRNELFSENANEKVDMKNDYFLTFVGDLGFFNTNLFISGEDTGNDRLVETIRLRGERVDPDGEVLGPWLDATRLRVGDVDTVRFPAQGLRSSERGFSIDNRPLRRSNDYDQTTISGDADVEWEVELYQNGRLIGVQDVGDDGYYEFADITLFYGRNDFELRFFGPFGERRTETRSIDVGRDQLKPGEFEWAASLVQQNTDTVERDDDSQSINPDDEELMGTGLLRFGVSPTASASAGVNSLSFEGERHTYFYAGGSAALPWRSSLFLDFLYDTQSGQKLQALLSKGFDGFSASLKHESFLNDYEDPFTTNEDTLHQTSLDLVPSGIALTNDIRLSSSFGVSRTQTKDDDAINYGVSNSLSLDLYQATRLSNSLSSGATSDDPGAFSENLRGSANFRGDYFLLDAPWLGQIEAFGQLDYVLRPEEEIETYEARITDRWRLTESTSFFVTGVHEKPDKDLDTLTSVGLGFGIRLGNLNIGPSFFYSDDGSYEVISTFRMPIALDPRSYEPSLPESSLTNTGGVSVRLFVDNNYNNEYDAGDEPIPDVIVRTQPLGLSDRTDEDGVALITGLPGYLPVDVEIATAENWEYYWTQSGSPVAVMPRLGKVYTIDYPVHVTGEVDGSVSLYREGETAPYPGAEVQLVHDNGTVAATDRSDDSGFYIFQGVRPGGYTTRVAPAFLEERGQHAMPSRDLDIRGKGEVLSFVELEVFRDKSAMVAQSAERFSEDSKELGVEKGFMAQDIVQQPATAPSSGFAAEKGFGAADIAGGAQAPATAPAPGPVNIGVHVASYRDRTQAETDARALAAAQRDILGAMPVVVVSVDLPGQGLYHRVVVDTPDNRARAQALANALQARGLYANVIDTRP